RNLLDDAVLLHVKATKLATREAEFEKVDELPFDFKRKRLSIIVKNKKGEVFLICKGAVEEVSSICEEYDLHGKKHKLTHEDLEKLQKLNEEKSNEGFRVIAVAVKKLADGRKYYGNKDEEKLTFLGFMTFFDPPKESAAGAIKRLEKYGITVKVLTGDNELVTKKVCKEVGLTAFDNGNSNVLLGSQIAGLSDQELEQKAETTTIFAKLSPDDKKRVVQALQKNHVVGFLGDGINDAPALRTADVGISVDSAVDIAKESADIILLELSLLVLADGVVEGRKVFGNIIKYIRMGASSNFGNMFSVLGASLFLPFLPMAPLQVIANNLLYDLSQTAIPTDTVDPEYIEKPRKWDIADIRRFMFFFGPTSSVFDYVTFGVMIFVFHAWLNNVKLFQTAWFVESLLTQTLIVHVIRSRKIP
ncbi:MAG: HAD-IC family P-type ATPase, partial [Patescibacteria group bacterium]|nr:HAD-IC family P-type ATPase [Patescibacteria group bacterium]